MTYDAIKTEVRSIIYKYLNIHVDKDDIPLTARPYGLDSRNLTAIFIDIERIFAVDM